MAESSAALALAWRAHSEADSMGRPCRLAASLRAQVLEMPHTERSSSSGHCAIASAISLRSTHRSQTRRVRAFCAIN